MVSAPRNSSGAQSRFGNLERPAKARLAGRGQDSAGPAPRRASRHCASALAWTFQPCEELAGDLLNIFLLDDRRVGFYVLDVSGHGVAASLLSVTVSHFLTPHGDNSLLKVPPRDGQPGRLAQPSDVIRRLNAQLCSERSEQFLTLFYGILDLASYTLCYANAAHPCPVVFSERSEPKELGGTGLPIGIVEEAEYEDAEVHLRPGDRFWLYSDGLLEAMNPADEQFGKDASLPQYNRLCPKLSVIPFGACYAPSKCGQVMRGQQDDISLVAFEIGHS